MKDLKSLTNALKHIELTSAEKTAGKAQFLEFMEAHPALVRAKKTHRSWFRPFRMLATAFVVLLVSTSGVSYAAESSVPGDLLYPIKINVNENIRSVLAFDPKSQAEWNIEQVERRLEEAETLKEEGRMTAETRVMIRNQIQTHMGEMKDHLKNLDNSGKTEDAGELKTRYEDLLQNHQDAADDIHVNTKPPLNFDPNWKPVLIPWEQLKETELNDNEEESTVQEEPTTETETEVETEIETETETETETESEAETETEVEAETETESTEEESTVETENSVDTSGSFGVDTSLPGINTK